MELLECLERIIASKSPPKSPKYSVVAKIMQSHTIEREGLPLLRGSSAEKRAWVVTNLLVYDHFEKKQVCLFAANPSA